MAKLSSLFSHTHDDLELPEDREDLEQSITQEEQKEQLAQDKSFVADHTSRTKRLQRAAEREVQTAAEDSIRKLHVIKMGRCPSCGEHVRRHLFATICESCGWHIFDAPRSGPVRVHLRDGNAPVSGERCYVVNNGVALVLKNDVVVAKIPRGSISWIEYLWSDNEIDQRHRQVVQRVELRCGWCGELAEPEKDGFHLVHVAFGASQERYCFCCDECYDAFRTMYPSRVHRNCYERNCLDCDLCIKRYDDEAEGIRLLAKDYLSLSRKKS